MKNYFYILSRTIGDDGGIYQYELGSHDEMTLKSFINVSDSNYIRISRDKRFMFATTKLENFYGVSSFAINDDGSLSLLSTYETGGQGGCYLITNEDDSYLYCGNYISGDISEFKLEDGKIISLNKVIPHYGASANKERQNSPHVHCVEFTPDFKFLLALDLGIDRIKIYAVKDDKTVDFEDQKSIYLSPGSGPRHIVFNKSGDYAFVINELSNSINSYRYASLDFEFMDSVDTLPIGLKVGSKAAAIRLSKDNHFLLSSNRGCDSITIFNITKSGEMIQKDLVLINGKSPRDINFINTNLDLLAVTSEFSDEISFFRYHNGKLTPLAQTLSHKRPLCVVVLEKY